MQIFDGITAAVFAVMVPLVVADLTRGTGRFNLGQGILGTATGIGASLSTTLGGYMTDYFGSAAAFAALATIGVAGFALVAVSMPETRPPEREEEEARRSVLGRGRRSSTAPAPRRGPAADAARRSPQGCDRRKDNPAPCGGR